MRQMIPMALALVCFILLTPTIPAQPELKTTVHSHTCDGSAAVAVDSTMFIDANDEDSILRVYRRDSSGPPIETKDLSGFLGVDPADSETDIEGAARVNDRVYWITSHGENKDGDPDPRRRRFFATDIKSAAGKVEIQPFGIPYRNLVEDLSDAPQLKEFHLAEGATKAPEKKDALNIEGLSATPKGELLIAFRNPIPRGKALLIPLKNPEEVVTAKNRAKLGDPILLSLGGLGVRSIEYSDTRSTYLIIAGAFDNSGKFKLYEWSGDPLKEPSVVSENNFGDLGPEALIIYPGEPRIQLLSDDGDRKVDGKKCKNVPEEKRSFRSFWISLP